MGSSQKRNAPSHNIALLIKLGIRDAVEMHCKLLLAHLQKRGQARGRYGLSDLGQRLENLPAGEIPHAIQLCGQVASNCIEGTRVS